MFSRRERYGGHIIEHAHFKHLQPNTDYTVRIGDKTLLFKTFPKDDAALRIAICGDAYGEAELCAKGLSAMASHSPRAVVIGGDIAYSRGYLMPFRGISYEIARWVAFFELWEKEMQTADGHTIPLIPCVGNHDLRPKNAWGPRGKAFYAFFPHLQTTYYSLPLGKAARLICLDSGHAADIEGEQADFLKNTLRTANEPYTLACYHIPAYPSYRAFSAGESARIRKAWVPLFDTYNLTAAFENDNHTYKRTKPLVQNAEAVHGTIYFGDGCLGVPPRHVSPSLRWYLEKTASENHFFLVESTNGRVFVRAQNLSDKSLDHITFEKTK